MIVLDTSGLLAAIGFDQRPHEGIVRSLSDAEPPLLLSPFIAAEVDYFLSSRTGLPGELPFLEDVARGVYRLESFDAADVVAAAEVIRRYGDLNIGLADASIVVLAERYRTLDVLTLDERHFRALRTLDGRPFRLLPADA